MNLKDIEALLKKAFPDAKISLDDDSERHRDHHPNFHHLEVTHAKLKIFSDQFKDLSMVKRHQLVYRALHQELHSEELHSLVIEKAEPLN